jgi:hypothetical protein
MQDTILARTQVDHAPNGTKLADQAKFVTTKAPVITAWAKNFRAAQR